MLRLILIFSLIGGLLCGQNVIAGEKEELSLELRAIRAEIQILQTEYATRQARLQEITKKLEEMNKKEVAKEKGK